MNKAIIECTPFDEYDGNDLMSPTFNTNSDPYFAIEVRNRKWDAQTYRAGWLDLTPLNMANKSNTNSYLSLLQTPGGITTDLANENYTGRNSVGRESLILLSPFGLKYRTARFMLESKYIVKLSSIELSQTAFKRRSI